MGNQQVTTTKENGSEIAYRMGNKYLIKRCDIICKYWVKNSKLIIPFDIIKLLSLFCKNTLQFTLFHPILTKEKIIKINDKLNEIAVIKNKNVYSTFICDKYPISINNDSFKIEIISSVNNMLIGLINCDFSFIKQNVISYFSALKGFQLKWDNYFGIFCHRESKVYYKKDCNIPYKTGDLLMIQRSQKMITFYKNNQLIYKLKVTEDKPFPDIMYPFISCYLQTGQHLRIF